MFRANFCPSSEAQDWGFFTTYGIVSCKDGNTNSYIVRMWYVVLINVIMNWGCVHTHQFIISPLFRYNYLFTSIIAIWNRVLLEKLTGFQLFKKFPAFYGTRKFNTSCTSAHNLSLIWASSIQSIPLHPESWRSIVILSSHLRLGFASGLLPSNLPTKTPYKPLLYHIHASSPAHLILLEFITRRIL